MTEKERLPAEVRVYSAQVPPRRAADDRSRVKRTAVICGLGTVMLAALSISEGDRLMLSGAAEAFLSRAADKAALIAREAARLEQPDISALLPAGYLSADDGYMNETPEAVNNTDKAFIASMSEEDIIMLSRGSVHMPSSVNEELFTEELLPPPEGDADPLPYPGALPSRDGVITQLKYERGTGDNYIDLPMGGQIRNVTRLSSEEIYENALLAPDFRIKLNAPEDEPQVLIMHTHTTESYEPDERGYYDSDYICRTTDSSRNMTAVGDAMTRVLESRGIRTYHDVTVHDYPSYNGSYDRSRATVSDILERYPSIKVVLDVHRDAIERESGERIAPTAVINGKSCAQVMLICGCDDGTMDMPECMKNLRAASLFEQHMESRFPGLTRPVLYDYRKYNQDLTAGSLLLEVGGHANSLEQAIYAGELSAEAIADALIKTSGDNNTNFA